MTEQHPVRPDAHTFPFLVLNSRAVRSAGLNHPKYDNKPTLHVHAQCGRMGGLGKAEMLPTSLLPILEQHRDEIHFCHDCLAPATSVRWSEN